MSITKKIASVFAGAVVALVAFGMMASLASAATCTAPVYSSTLRVGSNGAAVMAWQSFLNVYMNAGLTVDGAYGPMSASKTVAFQAANALTADGVAGPMTYSAAAAVCADTDSDEGDEDGGNDNGGSDSDAEGNLESIDQLGQYSNEEVGEDEEEVGVIGFEMEADGADQMIERVTVIINAPSDPTEDDLEDFVTEVAVELDGEILDTMDVEDASYDRTTDKYTFRFTGLDGVIEDGEDAKLVVLVSGTSNVSSDIDGEGWDVAIDSIRATSPNGVTETYTEDESANDLNGLVESFTLETFASANNVELKASKGDDTPVEGSVEGDDGDSFDVDLLEFELEAEESDITVYSLRVTLGGTFADAEGGTAEDFVTDLMLSCDNGEDYSETPATVAVTFDLGDDGIEIEEGDTLTCMVTAEMVEISAADALVTNELLDGDIISADLTVASTDAEDQTGEAITGGDLTGTANGYDQTLSLAIATLSNVTWTVLTNGSGLDLGFTVEAGDEDVDVTLADLVAADTVTGSGTVAAPTLTLISGDAIVNTPGSDYTVEDGDDATFSLVYENSGADSTTVRVNITTIAGQNVPDNKETSPLVVKDLN